jgi:hypothetical protein
MAFPVPQATAETAVSTAGTSHVINLPTGIVAGDLLMIFTARGVAVATFNALAGWSELVDDGAANGVTIWYRQADGSEGATVTFTSSAATRSASIAYRISGAANPATRPPEISAVATGSSTNPNPSSLTPTGGAKDYLWFAMFARSGEEADDDTWVTAAPTNFTGLLQKACGVAGTNLGGMVATATQQANAASLDPATFTCATGGWRAHTVVVHPDPRHLMSLTPVVETDTAQPVAAKKQLPLGVATEGDAAVAVAPLKGVDLMAAIEADAAVGLALDAGKTLTPVVEADQALALAVEARANLTPVVEADQAQALGARKSLALTPAVTVDSAVALAFVKLIQKVLTPGVEADAAVTLDVTHDQLRDLSPAVEGDAATPLSLTHIQDRDLTPVTEADVAQALSFSQDQSFTLTPAGEADAAQTLPVVHIQYRALTPAGEVDAAQALSVTHVHFVALVPADEADAAVDLSISHAGSYDLTPAEETDTALPQTYVKRTVLVAAVESDAAQALSLTKTIYKWLTAAVETDIAIGATFEGGGIEVVMDVEGFKKAMEFLNQQLGQELEFRWNEATVWPAGTQIDPETGEPYDAFVTPESGGGQVSATITATPVFDPIEGDLDEPAEWTAGGMRLGNKVAVLINLDDYPAVQNATEVVVNGVVYAITEFVRDTAPAERWVAFGESK